MFTIETFRGHLGTITIQEELILDDFTLDIINLAKLKHRLQSFFKHSKARIVIMMLDTISAMNILSAADDSVMGGAGYS